MEKSTLYGCTENIVKKDTLHLMRIFISSVYSKERYNPEREVHYFVVFGWQIHCQTLSPHFLIEKFQGVKIQK